MFGSTGTRVVFSSNKTQFRCVRQFLISPLLLHRCKNAAYCRLVELFRASTWIAQHKLKKHLVSQDEKFSHKISNHINDAPTFADIQN